VFWNESFFSKDLLSPRFVCKNKVVDILKKEFIEIFKIIHLGD